MANTIKMITEHLFSEDFRRIPAKIEYREETEITPDELAQWLYHFEDLVQKGILKKYENEREIGFTRQADYARMIWITFQKVKEA